MSRESGGKRRRMLFLIGLVIALIPMTSAPRPESTCDSDGSVGDSLACAPVDLIRILGPLVRHLLLSEQPAGQ